MSVTGRGGDTEPGRALRAPTTPGAVLAATDGGERVCFSSPAGLSVWRVLVAAYPWPAALYRGPCPPAVGTALLPTRRPSFLASGGEERLDRQNRNIQDQEGDTIMAICAPCRVPHGVEQCEDTQAGRRGVSRACYCQHKTHPVDTAEVSPGPEWEIPAENGTGRVGAVGHTAGNEERTPR